MDFVIFISIFIAQRISELLVARKNEKWLRAHGAIEYGQKHYPYVVLLHVCFILSLIFEYWQKKGVRIDFMFLYFFIILIATKIWVILSLGKYWNTKIYRIHGAAPIRKGAYKFFRHPNYVIVVLEFMVVPLVFHLYYTGIIFSLLNALMLWVRIKEEEKVWGI